MIIMPYIQKEVLNELKRIDLLTYFKLVNPNELVNEGNGLYTTKTHDSLKISNGVWNWFSRGVGGKNAIDYIMEDEQVSFIEAVRILIRRTNVRVENYEDFVSKMPQYVERKLPKDKKIILPEKNEDNRRIFAYLMSRGIDKEVINYCIDSHFLYEEKEHHNVVFLGYDERNEVKFGCARASNQTRFMIDLKGSSKENSFRLLSQNQTNEIHLFESAIDLLSYATLIKLSGKNFRDYNLISLSGVYQTARNIEESKVPIAIQKYLENHKEIDTIVLHFDNDLAGRNATKAMQIRLQNDYKVKDNPSNFGKDVNDFLVHKLEEDKKKSRSYER